MQLTRYTDYSLRVLIYLATHRDRLVTIAEMADAYVISRNHLMKIVHHLARAGYVETVRGVHGGVRLGREPEQINLGEVVRETEEDFALVPCLGAEPSDCVIDGPCRLTGILGQATQAFLRTLGRYTLADIVRRPRQLVRVLEDRRGRGDQ